MTDTPTRRGAAAELAHTLRELRAHRDPPLSQRAAAELAGDGFSQSKVARWESGALTPTPLDAARYAHRMGATRTVLRDCVRLALEVRDEHAGLAPIRSAFVRRPGLGQRQWRHRERDAQTVITFHPAVVPGLLQTEDYMRAIYRSAHAADPAGEDEFVRERTARQHARAHLPAVQLLTAGALSGGSMPVRVRLAQCAHIADLTRTRTEWEIGLIPDDAHTTDGAQAYSFPVSGFDLYDQSHAVVGTEIGPARTTSPDAIDTVLDRVRVLREAALFGQDARAELERIAERIGHART